MLSFRNVALFVAIGLALSSCGDADTSEGTAPAIAEPSADAVLQNADLGPLAYQFDPNALTAVDVEITIPPGYETTHPATKLLPEARARLLGQERCMYGESGETSECDAQKEVGLTLALLARPIAEYRQAFDEAGLEYDDPDGTNGFSFTAQAEGRGVQYSFFGLNDRTILLARQFDSASEMDADAAITDVIRSLSESVDERVAQTG